MREFVLLWPQDYVGPLSTAEPDSRGQDVRSLGGHERREGRAAGHQAAVRRGRRRTARKSPFSSTSTRSARELDHPHVIKIYEFGTDRDAVYLVMELFPTPNVKQLINQGCREARSRSCPDCIRQAGEGLAYFHSQGWIHRDIKPDNFLMNSQGRSEADRLRAGGAAERGAGAAVSPARRKCRARAATCRPSKSAASRSTSGPTSTASAAWSHELLGGKPPYTGTTHQRSVEQASAVADSAAASARTATSTDDFAQLVRAHAGQEARRSARVDGRFSQRDARACRFSKSPPDSRSKASRQARHDDWPATGR